MAKFTLAVAPTFKAKVDIPIAGGKASPVEFTFKHRTKDEFDEWQRRAAGKTDLELVMEMASGWELTDAWSEEKVGELLQNYYGAGAAISRKYATELIGARLGN